MFPNFYREVLLLEPELELTWTELQWSYCQGWLLISSISHRVCSADCLGFLARIESKWKAITLKTAIFRSGKIWFKFMYLVSNKIHTLESYLAIAGSILIGPCHGITCYLSVFLVNNFSWTKRINKTSMLAQKLASWIPKLLKISQYLHRQSASNPYQK